MYQQVCGSGDELKYDLSIVYPIFRCEELSWVDWDVTELDKGYMYCCDLKSAASALEEIKSLNLKTNVGLIQIT